MGEMMSKEQSGQEKGPDDCEYKQLDSLNTPNPVHLAGEDDDKKTLATGRHCGQQPQPQPAGGVGLVAVQVKKPKEKLFESVSDSDKGKDLLKKVPPEAVESLIADFEEIGSFRTREEKMKADFEVPLEDMQKAMKSNFMDREKNMKADFEAQLEEEQKATKGKMSADMTTKLEEEVIDDKMKVELEAMLEKVKKAIEDEKENWKMEVMKAKEAAVEHKQELDEEWPRALAEIEELEQANELLLIMMARELDLKIAWKAENDELKVVKESLATVTQKYEDASKQFAEKQKSQQSKIAELEKQLAEETEQHQHDVKQYQQQLTEEQSKCEREVEQYQDQLVKEKNRHEHEVRDHQEKLASEKEKHQGELRRYQEQLAEKIEQHQCDIEQYCDQLMEERNKHQLEVREHQERYAAEREHHQSQHENDTKKWLIFKKENEEAMQALQAKNSRITHESKQMEFQFTHKLNKMQSCIEKAQKEADAKCDQLKDERDTFQLKMNQVSELYEEQKQTNQAKVEELERERQHMQNRITLLKSECKSLHETSAATRQELDAANHEIDEIKQWRDYYFHRLEVHIADTGKISDELSIAIQERAQAETRITKLQEEKVQIIQELKNEIDFIRARCDDYEEQLRMSEKKQRQLETQWVVERREIDLTGPELGRGSWATVYAATFRGVCVAAKCVHNQIISDYNISLFKREMSMAAKIRHPNLLQFIGATLEGQLIILTELMPTSLRREVESRQERNLMSLEQVTCVSLDVARALNYLHLMQPHPLIHRDISSANILLQPLPNGNWRAKVSDYGTVNLFQELQTANPGSPSYSAPEANDPTQQSPKMDIFSFGVLLLEMLTGEFPDSDKRARQLLKISNRRLYFNLIQSCLNQEREKRPSALDIVSQLTS